MRKNQILGLVFRQGRLQRRETRHLLRIQGAHLTIDDAVGQACGLFGDGRELFGPVQPAARANAGFTDLHSQLGAVAVKFHLVAHPAVAGGRSTSLQSCGSMKLGTDLSVGPLARDFAVAAVAGGAACNTL